jgi:hypothetical protein
VQISVSKCDRFHIFILYLEHYYIGRVKELKRTSSRHSNFYIGLYGFNWLDSWFNLADKITQLMNLSPNKRSFYQRGQKAMILILSAF